MKISVLIPAFNADPFIATALSSVREQTHTDWEVIIVEDGSRGRTEDIVRAFAAANPQRVVYENLGANYGVGAVRNRLLDLACGDAVAFLDADDTWDPAHLANAARAIGRGSNFIVSGVRTVELSTGKALQTVVPPDELVRDPVVALFRESVIITSSSVALTRELAKRTGHFDSSLRIGEDRDYWLRCALAGARFHIVEGHTCNYSKHPASSMSHTYVVAQHNARFYEKYQALSVVPPKLRRRLVAQSLLSLGRLMRNRDRKGSIQCLCRALRYEPFNPRILAHIAVTGLRATVA